MELLLRAAVLPLLVAILVPYHHSMTSLADASKAMPMLVDRKAYIARISIVIDEENYARSVTERWDETQQKASLTVINGDMWTSVIYDYDLKRVTGLQANIKTQETAKCYVATLTSTGTYPKLDDTNDLANVPGWQASGGKEFPHMFSTKDAFSKDRASKMVYKGRSLVDGIEADYWTNPHVDWPDKTDTFGAYYYFALDEWTAAESSSPSSVYPLRIEINGTKTSGGTTTSFHHYYDYIDFALYDSLPAYVFDTGSGEACVYSADYKKKELMPSLPNIMEYDKEVVDENGKTTLASVVYNPEVGIMHFYTSKQTVMYDLNAGVKYVIDASTAKCTTVAMDSKSDNDGKGLTDYIEDMGPAEFYLLNKTYQFDGADQTRSIDSFTWGGTINSKVFDIHFAKLSWHFANRYNSTPPPPLSLTRGNKRYNFFNFHSSGNAHFYLASAPNMMCTSVKRLYVYIDFQKHQSYYSYQEPNVWSNEIMGSLIKIIAKNARVYQSQISIDSLNSYWEEKVFHLSFVLHAPPSPTYLYKRQQKSSITKSSSYNYKTATVPASKNYDDVIEKSAQMCENETLRGKVSCKSFDLCKSSDGSYSVTMFTALPTSAHAVHSDTCDHFNRIVDTKPSAPLNAAWSNLKDQTEKGNVKISEDNGDYKLTGYNAKRSSFSLKNYGDTNFDKFRYIGTAGTLDDTETVTSYKSEALCREACLERTEYECRGFKYCHGTHECILSKTNPVASTNPPAKISCLIYERNYITEYTKMDYLTIQTSGKHVFNNVKDANGCASKCSHSNTKQFDCESFNYCEDSKQCELSAVHAFDDSANMTVHNKVTCAHYSKTYLLDYKEAASTAVIPNAAYTVETINSLSAEQCAYLCSTGYDGTGCVEFDFCEDISTCHIVSGAAKKGIGHVAKAYCGTYTKVSGSEGSGASSSPLTQSPTTTTYSNASFGGLAFAMVLVGLTIGAVLFLVLYKRKYIFAG